jgi:hypothetical protein
MLASEPKTCVRAGEGAREEGAREDAVQDVA